MMLELVRYSFGSASTLGLLFDATAGRKWLCYTLEDKVRETKIPEQTAIPAGEYEITLRREGGFHNRYSKAFGDIHRGMLWLRDVPGFEFILIHCGNTIRDTAGCILVGDGAAQNVTQEGSLTSSQNAYRRIYPPIAKAIEARERVVVRIVETRT